MKKLFTSVLIAALPVWALAQATTPASVTQTKVKKAAVAKPAAEAALTPAQLAIAERVQVGQLPCEMGNSVSVMADPKAPGYFNVQVKNIKYRMSPVETSTGAIRLEDPKAGAVWLQLANKSMLMNQKIGKRLADECASPAQLAVAESLKKNPGASVLDAPAANGQGTTATK
jgi:hypothetical protein